MISVDTNVIVRLLTSDEQMQFQRAKALFEVENISIATSVILECEWVLRYAYHFKPYEIISAFKALFGLSNVNLMEPLVIHNGIEWHMSGMDFADAIHLSKSQECESFATFDKNFIESSKDVSKIPVYEP